VPKRTSKPSLAAEAIPGTKKNIPEQQEYSQAKKQQKQNIPVDTSMAEAGAEAEKHPYLTTIIDATPATLIALDETFHIVDCNAAAGKTLGASPARVIGRNCAEILTCHNLNRMKLCGTSSCPLARVLQQNQPLPNEELIIGDGYEVSAIVTPIVTPLGSYVAFTARDTSTQKVANQVRSNFVSMVSHELRTPLNSVHGFIDLIMQGHMGELNAEQFKYLGYAQEGVQQLISIAEDIVFMTRSDVGQFEIKQEEVNFRVLARQVVNSLETQAHKASVVLLKDIPLPSPLLYIDPQRMKQVLNNLVINAIKFTPPGGTVTIRARPYDEQHVMISVVDTGYGIPLEDRPHVFERFYQSNHILQSRMGGYGLGLSIAKLIVEQHGGIIDFESTLNEGTTFYFTAPLYKL
jgi:PAS domain S-box-containing protein